MKDIRNQNPLHSKQLEHWFVGKPMSNNNCFLEFSKTRQNKTKKPGLVSRNHIDNAFKLISIFPPTHYKDTFAYYQFIDIPNPMTIVCLRSMGSTAV